MIMTVIVVAVKIVMAAMTFITSEVVYVAVHIAVLHLLLMV